MNANLVRVKKSGSPKIFPLAASPTLIGRQHDCNLCIPVPSVSKKHCELIQDGKVWKIRDLGSHNGTFLNGKRIEKEAELQPGNSLTIGPLTFVLQIDGQPDLNSPQQKEQAAQPLPQQTDQTPPLENTEKTATEDLLEDDQFANFSDLQLNDLKSLESEENDSA